MDWIKSENINFEINGDETIHFQCGSGIQMQNYILKIVVITVIFILVVIGGSSLMLMSNFDNFKYFIMFMSIALIVFFIAIFSMIFKQKWLYLKKT